MGIQTLLRRCRVHYSLETINISGFSLAKALCLSSVCEMGVKVTKRLRKDRFDHPLKNVLVEVICQVSDEKMRCDQSLTSHSDERVKRFSDEMRINFVLRTQPCQRRSIRSYHEATSRFERDSIAASISDEARAALQCAGYNPRLCSAIAARGPELALNQTEGHSLRELYELNKEGALSDAEKNGKTNPEFMGQLHQELSVGCAWDAKGNEERVSRLLSILQSSLDQQCDVYHQDGTACNYQWSESDMQELRGLMMADAKSRKWPEIGARRDLSPEEKKIGMARKLLTQHSGYKVYLDALVAAKALGSFEENDQTSQ